MYKLYITLHVCDLSNNHPIAMHTDPGDPSLPNPPPPPPPRYVTVTYNRVLMGFTTWVRDLQATTKSSNVLLVLKASLINHNLFFWWFMIM